SPGWHWDLEPQRIDEVLATAWNGLVPLPDLHSPFPWNSNLADDWPTSQRSALGILALAAGLLALRRDRLALLYLVCAGAGVLTFAYVKYLGYLRHHGHLALALVLALWMDARRAHRGALPSRSYFRRGWFVAQAAAGLMLAWVDWWAPFSANRLAAQW